jgi:hypothetical protein
MTGKPFHPAIVEEMQKAFSVLDFPVRQLDVWRPMGTAPKDGTEVELLLWHRNHRYAADWDRKNWEQIVTAEWIDFNGGGWTWNGMCGDPQCWRPLPAN